MFRIVSFYKFVLIFSVILIIFGIYHLTVWHFYTSKIFDTKPYIVGDIGRMSYSIDSLHYRVDRITLPNKMISYDKYINDTHVDIVTIGDSFSNGGACGENPYYQDFLASKTNKIVLNIQNINEKYTYIETLHGLLDKGWFDKIKPKIVILETVARRLSDEYSKEQDWNIKLDNSYESRLYGRPWRDVLEKPSIINTANYKLLYYNFMYKYKINAQKDVFKFKISKPLFSVKENQVLLVHKDDIESLNDFESFKNVQRINDNINKLALKLKAKGIQLYFMPAVDKYDLYSKYIIDNKYDENKLFSSLKGLQKEYKLIDTKSILEPLLDKGIEDIYYADDTHWSYKASEEIVKSMKDKI